MGTPRRRVLDLLQEGTIDASQAEDLLDALDRQPPPPPLRTTPQGRAAADPRQVKLSVEQLVELASHDVNAAYIRDMSATGIVGLTVEGLVELASHDVSPQRVQEWVTAGLPSLTVEEAITLADHDVTPKLVSALFACGIVFAVGDITELADNDVGAAYVRDLVKAGLTNLTVEQIVELAQHDVDPSLAAAQLGDP